MLALKIITASVLLLSVAFRTVMDFVWKDKRTNRYRYTRNGFIIAALLAALLNLVVLAVDEAQKQTKAELEAKHRNEIEDLTLGILSPEIWVFLYRHPGVSYPPEDKLPPPLQDLASKFLAATRFGPVEGDVVAAIIVRNTNSIPVYDLKLHVRHDLANPNFPSRLMEDFNKQQREPIPVLYPSEPLTFLCSFGSNVMSTMFEFDVQTRRGGSKHRVALTLISNQWEYGSVAVDKNHGNRIFSLYISDGFPKDSNGVAIMPVMRKFRVSEGRTNEVFNEDWKPARP